MRKWVARMTVMVVAALWALAVVGTTGCGKEEDPAAQGYYEGPMLPKSQRTGSAPAQGTAE